MNRLPRSFLASGLLAMLFLYGPVVILIVLSFNVSTMGVAWKGFSFQWYEQLLSDASILDATLNSLSIAMASTVLSLVLGVGTLSRHANAIGSGTGSVGSGAGVDVALEEPPPPPPQADKNSPMKNNCSRNRLMTEKMENLGQAYAPSFHLQGGDVCS